MRASARSTSPASTRRQVYRRMPLLKPLPKFSARLVIPAPSAQMNYWDDRSIDVVCSDLARPNPARAAARLPVAPSPYSSGRLRPAISSREPPVRPGWPRPSSHAPARPCPTRACALSTACCRRSRSFCLSGLFPRPFTLAALLFPFVGESGLPLRRLVDGAGGGLLRCTAFRLAGSFRRSFAAAQIGGQFGVLAEGPVGSDGAPENDARLLPWSQR